MIDRAVIDFTQLPKTNNMKKLSFIMLAVAATWTLQGCNGNTKTDSKASADSVNAHKDSVADSSKSVTKDLVMKVNKGDAKFAVEAANGGMAEVELGKLAQQKATDPQVKDFGSMMVSDHSKANDELKTLAKDKGITLPDSVGEKEQKLMTDLSAKSGKDFDKAYVEAMVKDHKEDIKAFEDAGNTLNDPDLKAFATKTLPTLRKHLTAIQKIQDQKK